MNALSTVPQEFIHVSDDEFQQYFLADRQRVFDHFGKVLKQRSFINKRCLSHLETANFYGGYAMHSMMTTSFRFWSSDGSNAKDVKVWTRLVWQLAHVYPLGFLYSHYRFGNQVNESWNPLKKTASQFDSSQRFAYQPSNRSLSGAPISQGIYLKLFPEMFEKLTSMQAFALLDIFSNTPNIDNPLYVALRNALRHTLFRYNYPVSFFWEQFMEHLLSQSPDDLALLEHFHQSIAEQDSTNVSHFAPANFTTPAENTVTTETKKITVPEHSDTQKSFDSIIQEIGNLVKKSLSAGRHRFNCQGALMHIVDSRMCFVHPLAFKEMATLYNEVHEDEPLTKESLIDLFTDNGAVLLIQGTLTPRTGIPRPIHLAELQSRLVSQFIPENLEISNNPDIELTECL